MDHNKTKLIIISSLTGLLILCVTIVLSLWLTKKTDYRAVMNHLAAEYDAARVEQWDEVKALDEKFKQAFEDLRAFEEACRIVGRLLVELPNFFKGPIEESLSPIRTPKRSEYAFFESHQKAQIRNYDESKLAAINEKYADKYPYSDHIDYFKKLYPRPAVEKLLNSHFKAKVKELEALRQRLRAETIVKAKKIRG